MASRSVRTRKSRASIQEGALSLSSRGIWRTREEVENERGLQKSMEASEDISPFLEILFAHVFPEIVVSRDEISKRSSWRRIEKERGIFWLKCRLRVLIAVELEVNKSRASRKSNDV